MDDGGRGRGRHQRPGGSRHGGGRAGPRNRLISVLCLQGPMKEIPMHFSASAGQADATRRDTGDAGAQRAAAPLIPMSLPDITQAEVEAVNAVLRTPYLSIGPRVDEFERRVAEYVGARHAVAVSSGTAGLHL